MSSLSDFCHRLRIERIASASSFSLDLTTLRASISELQAASRELDAEKTRAERKFRCLLKKLPHWGSCRRRRFRRIRKWIKGVFGQETTADQPGVGERDLDAIVEALLDGLSGSEPGERGTHRLPERVLRRLHRAAKRVRAANRKLKAFERGWISEGGIRDREWYKHLLVAPGKWLGQYRP
jgi:N-acetylated-alpha-linked acidic dipeptidase